MYGPNTNLAVGTIIYMIESQIGYIADALRVLRDRRARRSTCAPTRRSS